MFKELLRLSVTGQQFYSKCDDFALPYHIKGISILIPLYYENFSIYKHMCFKVVRVEASTEERVHRVANRDNVTLE